MIKFNLRHECGRLFWNCQCGYTTAFIIAAVAAAALAGYGAYASSEAQAQNADAQRRSARMAAEAEAAAGEARRQQAKARANRFLESQRSRAASGNVQVGEGSLLEGMMEASSLAQYESDLEAYPHVIASQRNSYEAAIFGWQARNARSRQGLNTGLAIGRSLASSYSGYNPPSGGQGSLSDNYRQSGYYGGGSSLSAMNQGS